MNLKALIAAAAVSTAFLGGAATAEAKPHETTGSICPGNYDLVEVVQLEPSHQTADANGNFWLCYSAVRGVKDDRIVGRSGR